MTTLAAVCWLVSAGLALAAQPPQMPDSVRVDVSEVLRPTERRIIGINVDYLMDGGEKLTVGGGLESALRKMGVKCLRYPGGDKSDNFLWSVPPYDRPRPAVARFSQRRQRRDDRLQMLEADGKTWKRPPLDFGEFMAICKALEAEPVICCAYDSLYGRDEPGGGVPIREQLIDTAAQWVRYANVTKSYGVRYWEIGNEGYIERAGPTAEQYARDLVLFARAMKEVDPTILIGANGPSGAHHVGAADAARGNQTPWWKTVFEIASAEIDFLAIHDYPCTPWKRYETYLHQQGGFGGAADGAVEAARLYCPPQDAEGMRVALTETNSADWSHRGWPSINNLGHALVLFDIIGSYLEHPMVDLLCVWNTRWLHNDKRQELWDALGPQNQLWPTGRVTAIWGEFARDNVVRAEGTLRVRAFASHSPATGELSVFLINKPRKATSVKVTLNGYATEASGERWAFTGTGPGDLEPTWGEVGTLAAQGGEIALDLPPVSLTVIALKPRD